MLGLFVNLGVLALSLGSFLFEMKFKYWFEKPISGEFWPIFTGLGWSCLIFLSADVGLLCELLN